MDLYPHCIDYFPAGVSSVQVVSIFQRPPLARTVQSPEAWVPWHLDRVNQRALPLDLNDRVKATGNGVHVYIISSGIRSDHQEFTERVMNEGDIDEYGFMKQPDSRVVGLWGVNDSDAMMDCRDAEFYYGRGELSGLVDVCRRTLGM